MQQITYRDLKQRSRDLRQEGTLGEVLLWGQLRRKQIRGYQFNRQKPLANFIVDFYCRKLNLVIEIDGSSHMHEATMAHGLARENKLHNLGLSILRFSENEVRNQIDDVLEKIDAWIEQSENEQNKRKS